MTIGKQNTRVSDESLKPARSTRVAVDFDAIAERAKQDKKIADGKYSHAFGDLATRDSNVRVVAQHARGGIK